jgi:hypothetical protein
VDARCLGEPRRVIRALPRIVSVHAVGDDTRSSSALRGDADQDSSSSASGGATWSRDLAVELDEPAEQAPRGAGRAPPRQLGDALLKVQSRPAARDAACASAAKPEALEARPLAVGKSFVETMRARRPRRPLSAADAARSADCARPSGRPLAPRRPFRTSDVLRQTCRRTSPPWSSRARRASRDRLGTAGTFARLGPLRACPSTSRARCSGARSRRRRPRHGASHRDALPSTLRARGKVRSPSTRSSTKPSIAVVASTPPSTAAARSSVGDEGDDAAAAAGAGQLGAEGARPAGRRRRAARSPASRRRARRAGTG